MDLLEIEQGQEKISRLNNHLKCVATLMQSAPPQVELNEDLSMLLMHLHEQISEETGRVNRQLLKLYNNSKLAPDFIKQVS